MVHFSIVSLLLRVNKNFIRFIKTRFARVNSDDHQHICLLWPQISVLLLSDLETSTLDYICFQVVPLRSIFLLCVSYKIRLNMGLFRPFYPQFGRIRWPDPDSTRLVGTKKIGWQKWGVVFCIRVKIGCLPDDTNILGDVDICKVGGFVFSLQYFVSFWRGFWGHHVLPSRHKGKIISIPAVPPPQRPSHGGVRILFVSCITTVDTSSLYQCISP